MKNNILISILIFLFILTGCFRQKRLKRPDEYIKVAKMTEILTDLYLTDGLLNVPGIRSSFSDKDSNVVYIEVMESFGVTKDVFEANINYYFVSRPKDFQAIYDNVLANLLDIQAENSQKRGKDGRRKSNLWNGKPTYRLPDDGTANPIEFSIPIEGNGLYTIQARANIFADDQSVELSAYLYFWYDDGTEEGHIEPWDRYFYEKTGRSATISIKKMLSDPKVTHLKGRLLDFKPQAGHWEMHSSVSGITIIFAPDDIEDVSDLEME